MARRRTWWIVLAAVLVVAGAVVGPLVYAALQDDAPPAPTVQAQPQDPELTGSPVTVPVTGELTLAGTTRPVTTELSVVRTADGVEVSGAVPVVFADFGIEPPNLGFVRVEDSGAVELFLRLTQ
ncbi:YceI family protein [Modestobacter sp. SYSU DS0511]